MSHAGQTQAIQNNLNSIIEGVQRIVAADDEDGMRSLIEKLRRYDSEVWLEVEDTMPISHKNRITL